MPLHPGQVHLDALRGLSLPPNFTCNVDEGVDVCVRHGIRHDESFAKSTEIDELCARPGAQAFARARNARLIMSNSVPDMLTDDVKPYCIWFPDVATEDTYRELARRYPDMRYHVARACAVAGYSTLYRELDILPDVSIAEEARDNSSANAGSAAILHTIVSQPVCYAVMDDYTRSVHLDRPRCPSFMNGDTAVWSSLDVRLGLDQFEDWSKHYFDIAEDCNVAEISSRKTYNEPLASQDVALLYTPLPPHLPTTNKDPLIVMAAYEGNLDRYVRLRRPFMVRDELYAVIRGIYHNTTFAKWWSLELLTLGASWWADYITAACTARFIMVNDLSSISPTVPKPDRMPAMIWWPLLPAEETLRELATRRPDVRLQVAMACVAADYRGLWDELAPEPSDALCEHARGGDPLGSGGLVRNYYTDYLESKWPNIKTASPAPSRMWQNKECEEPARRDKEPTATLLLPGIFMGPRVLVDGYDDDSVYPGRLQANASRWELFMCVSDGLRRRAVDHEGLELYPENGGPSLFDSGSDSGVALIRTPK